MSQKKYNIWHELIAAFSLFCSAAYVLILIPNMLGTIGYDFNLALTATCVSLFVGTLLCGALAKKPFAMGPGIAITAYLTQIVRHKHYTLEQIFVSGFICGLCLLIFCLSKWRHKVAESIPGSLITAMVAGIGLLIILVGINHAKITWTPHIHTILDWAPLWIGLLLICIMDYNKIPGSLLAGIIATALFIHWRHPFSIDQWHQMPSYWPHAWSSFNQAISPSIIPIIFSFLVITFFDFYGTMLSMNGLLKDRQGVVQDNRKRSLLANAISCLVSSSLGTSNCSLYVESAAAIRENGKTGITAVVCSILFLAVIFIAPIVASIPASATAPALIYVGACMLYRITKIDTSCWQSILCAAIVMAVIPLTTSIANGIGAGVIAYTLTTLRQNISRDKRITLIVMSSIFITYFVLTTAQMG